MLATDQLGTQLDPPAHWDPDYPAIDELPPTYAVRPLVVISIVEQVAKRPRLSPHGRGHPSLGGRHGRIPEGSVVFVRSDWSKDVARSRRSRPATPFPGVSLEALQFLHQQRHILFHGHEPLDTDTTPTLEGEAWLLHNGYTQAEGVANLDQVPETGGLVAIGYPQVPGRHRRLRALHRHLPAGLEVRRLGGPGAGGAAAASDQAAALGHDAGHAGAPVTVCVVGAGAGGLAAARHLKAGDIAFEVIERERDVGGIWDASLPHSPVYHSAHLISSKPLTQFPDFPMPKEYPDYPNRAQALAYLRAYAKAYALYDDIRFGRVVERAERAAGEGWRVTLRDGRKRGLLGADRRLGRALVPSDADGAEGFEGMTMHSCGYKSPEVFRGRRVLVVGAGNSGCDIAVEAGRHAERAFLSVRRGYHFIPKYAFGRPTDQVGEVGLRLRLPLGVRRGLNDLVLRTVVGRPEDYGLPRPDHRLLESHPIVNSEILPAIRRGEVRPKPDLVGSGPRGGVQGRHLGADRSRRLRDGISGDIPLPRHPRLNSTDGRPNFYLHTFHPTYDDLFIVGNLQPDSGVWPLMDLQAKAVAGSIRAGRDGGAGMRRLRTLKAGPRPDLSGGIRYVRSERHWCEVEHSSYGRRLQRVIRLLGSLTRYAGPSYTDASAWVAMRRANSQIHRIP